MLRPITKALRGEIPLWRVLLLHIPAGAVVVAVLYAALDITSDYDSQRRRRHSGEGDTHNLITNVVTSIQSYSASCVIYHLQVFLRVLRAARIPSCEDPCIQNAGSVLQFCDR